VHVTAAILQYTTPLNRVAHGVATSWLAGMVPSETGAFANRKDFYLIFLVSSCGEHMSLPSTPFTHASSFALTETVKVPISIRVSGFRLPNKPSTPIIMIGPGTGLAPFRGFIQERALQRKNGAPVGETVLFFGCQKAKEHFMYERELKDYAANGDISHLHVAFSRDQVQLLKR
jgi:NADPH-ferrihemoprotein reductase